MFLNSYVKSRFALACFVSLAVATFLFLKHRSTLHTDLLTPLPLPRPNSASLLVDTTGCKIPFIDPFDDTVRHLVNESIVIDCGPARTPLTYTDNGFLRVNLTAAATEYDDELDYCEYQTIIRGSGDPEPGDKVDNTFTYGKTVRFSDDVDPEVEFLRVACYGKRGSLMYTNFHAMILVDEDLERRCKRRFNRFMTRKRIKEAFNLLILGVDSVSRLNFMRHMPRTRSFLLDELKAVDLVGYNKVADNTYVNLVPMFAGKYVEELPWDETNSDVPFDNFTFIWNNFSTKGYRTLYAEDAPHIAIFNYNKAGFHRPPADYYLRPFSLALEDHGSMWREGSTGPRNCVGGKLETERVLEYITEFEETFRAAPHLSFAFLTRLTHENINKAAAADEPYFQFFHHLHANHLLNNTIIIFYSDHGMRFGDIRQTYVGKMEERLPFLFLVFPPHFHDKYPGLVAAVRLNSVRLTTPFDIYETLKDLLDFRDFYSDRWNIPSDEGDVGETDDVSEKPIKRGFSLFDEVPLNRTCSNAGIMPHWCACHRMIELDPAGDQIVIGLARRVVTHINGVLTTYGSRCAKLSLAAVLDARKVIPYKEVMLFRQSLHDVIGRVVKYEDEADVSSSSLFTEYQLTFTTSPSGGMFEATVRHFPDDSLQIAFISRINEYGNQSACIDIHQHKKYCLCTV